MAQPGLPLSGEFEAGRRSLEDVLQQILAQIVAERGQVNAQGTLVKGRLATDEGMARSRVDEDAIGRGLFRSTVRDTNQAETGLTFDRQRQDLASQLAQQLGGLSAREGEARGAYGRGLSELLLERARQATMQRNLGSYGLGKPAALPKPAGAFKAARRPRRRRPRQVTTSAAGPSKLDLPYFQNLLK